MTTMKRRYPDGMALEPGQVLESNNGGDAAATSESIDNLFITMVRSAEMIICLSHCSLCLYFLISSPSQFTI
jgi:hypothetical protein